MHFEMTNNNCESLRDETLCFTYIYFCFRKNPNLFLQKYLEYAIWRKKIKSQIRLKNVTTKQHQKRGWANSQPLQLQLPKYKNGFFYLGHHNKLNWKVVLKTKSLFFIEQFTIPKKNPQKNPSKDHELLIFRKCMCLIPGLKINQRKPEGILGNCLQITFSQKPVLNVRIF